jgi:hypothetical protein
MKLADKGPIKPPPVLKGPAQLVSQEIQSWPGIVAATHWFLYDQTQVDGVDFYVGDRELGHIHLDGEIHLGTTRPLGAMLIEHGLADPFEWHDECCRATRSWWQRKRCPNAGAAALVAACCRAHRLGLHLGATRNVCAPRLRRYPYLSLPGSAHGKRECGLPTAGVAPIRG